MRNCSYDKTLVMSQEEPEAIFLKCTWSKIVKMFQIFPEQFCWVATTKFFRCGLGCFGSNNVEFLLWQFRNCFSLFSGPYCWITAHTIFWRRFRVFFATIDFNCSQNKIWKCLTFFPEQFCCFAAETSSGRVFSFEATMLKCSYEIILQRLEKNFEAKLSKRRQDIFLKMAQALGK